MLLAAASQPLPIGSSGSCQRRVWKALHILPHIAARLPSSFGKCQRGETEPPPPDLLSPVFPVRVGHQRHCCERMEVEVRAQWFCSSHMSLICGLTFQWPGLQLLHLPLAPGPGVCLSLRCWSQCVRQDNYITKGGCEH